MNRSCLLKKVCFPLSIQPSMWFVGLFLFFCDQLVKFLVYRYLPSMENSSFFYPYGGIGVFEDFLGIEFSITYLHNTGAAWGIFQQYPFFLLFIRFSLILGLVAFLCVCQEKTWRWPLTLILAGAAANVVDFFIYGSVVDMFHFVLWNYSFPVFNIADASISIGVLWLLVLSFLKK